MTFSTGIFAFFLGLALALYWTAPAALRRYVMIAAGLVFYGYYLPKYLFLISSMTVVAYIAARAMLSLRRDNEKKCARVSESGPRGRLYLVGGVVFSLLILGFFKYWKMAADTVNSLLTWMDWGISIPIPQILVPLGISYITFELIHFLADVYTGRIKPATVSATNLALFTFFFPTMVSGPIKRYQLFQEQTVARLPFDGETFFYGAYRVVLGLGKKFIIADTVGRLTTVLATPETAAPGMLVLGIYAYAIKIYFDFAGYSDIAIGISRMFGYRVPENFDRPYLQPNIAEFWRRWHMSLSSWIRDYIYIPLGGSRRGLPRTLVNLVVAFTLCGLWHGAAWNFVVWGAWHGLGMAVHRLWRQVVQGAPRTAGAGVAVSTGLPFSDAPVGNVNSTNNYGARQLLARAAGVFLTFHFVTAGWVLFAAPDLTTALKIFAKCMALF